MSYQVLARKWRPRIFREMVGQEHVLRALINALDHKRLHHAYLFTGTRGVGKTTIARILAKCLNCESGISSEPCDSCSSCREISEGRFVDLIEVDAASRTKVEDTRELLDNVQYAPTRGRYKIYLIDEVHMLSNSSFNALLKTLEEPPEHVKFLLATTDPQKLPVTVLSRCLQFNLKNLSPERIVQHLQFVLEQEVIPCEEAALWQLARSADGSMRDALSLTDQAIAFGGGKVLETEVSSMLGTIDQRMIDDIMHALVAEDGAAILAAIARFAEHSPDYDAALADLLTLLHRIAIAQALPEALDNSFGDRTQILQFARQLAAEDVQLFYQTALMGRRDLPYASEARVGFEMTLLRMLAFKPQGLVDIPKQRLGDQPATPAAAPETAVPPAVAKGVSTATAPAPTQTSVASEAHPQVACETEVNGGKKFQTTAPEPPAQVPVEARPLNAAPAIPAASYEADGEEAPDEAIYDEYVSMNADSAVEAVIARLESESASPTAGRAEQEGVPHARESGAETVADAAASAVNRAAAASAEPTMAHAGPPADQEAPRVRWEALAPQDWIALYHQLGIRGVIQSTAANCVLVAREGNVLQFILDAEKTSLFDPSHSQRLAALLSDYFAQPVRADIHVGQVPEGFETPAVHDERVRNEKRADALATLQNDPVVQALQSHFDAVLKPDTITF